MSEAWLAKPTIIKIKPNKKEMRSRTNKKCPKLKRKFRRTRYKSSEKNVRVKKTYNKWHAPLQCFPFNLAHKISFLLNVTIYFAHFIFCLSTFCEPNFPINVIKVFLIKFSAYFFQLSFSCLLKICMLLANNRFKLCILFSLFIHIFSLPTFFGSTPKISLWKDYT